MTSTNLAETLFGAYRRRILALLLLHSEQSYYVRELARLAEVPPGSLHRELKLLAATGLLIRTPVGNQVRYQANRECPVFAELAGFFRKTAGLADVLRDALVPLAGKVKLAFIFGSFAQGKEQVNSDVDVLLVGDIEFAGALQALAPTQQRLSRQVNPVVMTKAEFLRKFQQNDRFIKRIVNEPKILLIESNDELAKLVQDRPD